MTEPDVTLTDYAIAVECMVFSVLLARVSTMSPALKRWWMVLFASTGVGAVFGGTTHGFFLDERSFGYRVLWPATLLALGVTSLAMWFVGSIARVPEPRRSWLLRAAVAAFLAYAVIVLFVDQRFLVAIAMYLPATVFLVLVLWVMYARSRAGAIGVAIGGLLLTFVAAAVQQLRIGVHPVWFNHNALYHVIQGIALAMIFVGARWLVTTAGAGVATT